MWDWVFAFHSQKMSCVIVNKQQHSGVCVYVYVCSRVCMCVACHAVLKWSITLPFIIKVEFLAIWLFLVTVLSYFEDDGLQAFNSFYNFPATENECDRSKHFRKTMLPNLRNLSSD